ncbi:PfkB family carbohydrate kinase [Nocardia blacklockiae]|uniref:PfkB family carbohydrate kinase n=1 Tax=Nocardia blacklockiae TaxID=480036 RepID=UPI001893062B|nr:PfkB family carbohydrate kinase [Nocardia blacklockiae]MBF6175326.1 bifunctional heptose 7-phosphate kinase/heptose 1-phosphate adenyltransferase [Nocardia blacklockiae]
MRRGRPLVIVGDTLLDVDIEGSARRLCPEAPVPVLDQKRRAERPGGAGLAAMLAQRHAADRVVLITALGDDPAAHRLRELLEPQVTVLALPLHGDTVCKTRARADGQSIVRIDSGDGYAAHSPLTDEIRWAIRKSSTILVADYGRGVTAHPELRTLLTEAAGRVPIVWDPHPRGESPVPGIRLATPNHSEATGLTANDPSHTASLTTAQAEDADATAGRRNGSEATGSTAGRQAAGRQDAGVTARSGIHGRAAGSADGQAGDGERARALAERWGAEAVVVTLGAQGAVCHDRRADRTDRVAVPLAMQTLANADTCGAGDQFAVAAALALQRGDGVRQAVEAGVRAAAEFVGKGGAQAAIDCPAMEDEAPGDAFALADRVRQDGGRLVATGGCFDLLHPGHISLLRQARGLGDALVVCLNSDDSIRRRKGDDRPVVPAADRARVLLELASVDAVVVFDEPTPTGLLDRLRPDVWVKGEDYAGSDLPEADTVRRHGGEIVLVPVLPGYSTTRLVAAARTSA